MSSLMRLFLLSGLLFSLVALTGCSLLPMAGKPVVEKPIDGLTLLPPVKSTATRILKQKVSLEKYAQTKQFIAVTRFSAQETKLVALLPTGQVFLYLLYDKHGFEEKNESGIALPSKDILAMIQFTFWPESVIKQGYPVSLGWQVEIMPDRRNLYYKNALLLAVKIEAEKVFITHHGDNYNVEIHTFDQEVLPL